MPEFLEFGPWDVVLIAAVTLLAGVIAYVYQPRWKALILSLPVPFTLASLSVARPIDSSPQRPGRA